MEYQKNSRRSHDSIIEWVKLWGFGLVLPQSCSAACPGPGLEPRLVLLPAQCQELCQGRAVLGLGPWQSCHTASVAREGQGLNHLHSFLKAQTVFGMSFVFRVFHVHGVSKTFFILIKVIIPIFVIKARNSVVL